MSSLSTVLQSRQVRFYSGALFAGLWGTFAYVHLMLFLETFELTLLLLFFSETLTAALFIFRSEPETVSKNPADWFIAVIGTFLPSFFRPEADGVFPLGNVLMFVGMGIQMLGLISLNRSFAIVAAKRIIKTAWMYRVVRHPIYASYCLMYTGYVLVHTSPANIAVYAVTVAFLIARIFREEAHLSVDPLYQEYMQGVRYRLVPFVF
ncbi:methyltransferase family protein [Pseudomonas costantinii]|uniref:Protein-S-isoprenylcysteine O-methyltransferase Ste14 n=1 Tax=Pseudomonas costantinii TaxID=168469 RepID=A0A1H4ZGS3_9PSED|nr:methyltransferase [Pseudomonas costantinii]NVZ22714.1 isoprenylcysteine carboxylmethyltransferase family protein [Pseudomonas costantinii]SED28848.1 Protein-S-isoprenylcysteine O-methyltransferase Ste14 [Pseudomonas costantinii]